MQYRQAKSFTDYFLLTHQEAEKLAVDGNELFKKRFDRLIAEAKPFNEALPELDLNEFLLLIFDDFFQTNNGYIEIRCMHTNKRISQDFYPYINTIPLSQLTGSSELEKRNIYMGVSPRKEKSGKEDSVKYITCLWADLDTEDSLQKIKQFSIKPSIIVNSGNGQHAYWLLDKPVKATREIKEILKGLQSAVGSDHVHDLSRVMRLPGSWNMKDASQPRQSKILRMEDVRYSIDDFHQFKTDEDQSKNWDSRSTGFKSVPVDLDKFHLSEKCIRIIKNGNNGYFKSRSEADYFVISSLIESDATDDEIYTIYNEPEYKISEKYHEKGKQGDSYLRHTITKARAEHNKKTKSSKESANQSNIIAEINLIRIMDKMPAFEKKQKISALIINHLKKKGQFYRTPMGYYFFDNNKKKLLDIESDAFNALLSRCSSLNPTEIEYDMDPSKRAA